MKIRARQCATRIYRPDSPLDLAALEREIADPAMPGHFRGARACHSADWPRRDVICAGFCRPARRRLHAGYGPRTEESTRP